MFDSLSIRLKIVLLSGLCLLGVVASIVGMNLYQTNQNDELVSASSSKMLTDSVQNLLQAKAAEQAVRVQKTFGETLTVVTALADQIKDMRNMAAKRSLEPGALREELNQSLKTAFERNGKVLGIWLAFEPNGLDGKDSEFVDDKARADQFFGEIDHRVGQEGQGHRIDQNLLSALFQHQILARRIIQPDVILKAGTAATLHGHAQGFRLAGHFGNLGQTGKGTVGHSGGQLEVHRRNFHILHGVFII